MRKTLLLPFVLAMTAMLGACSTGVNNAASPESKPHSPVDDDIYRTRTQAFTACLNSRVGSVPDLCNERRIVEYCYAVINGTPPKEVSCTNEPAPARTTMAAPAQAER